MNVGTSFAPQFNDFHECTQFGEWEVHEDYRLRVCVDCGEIDIDAPYYDDDDYPSIDDHYEMPDLPEPCEVCDGQGWVNTLEPESAWIYGGGNAADCPKCGGSGYATTT